MSGLSAALFILIKTASLGKYLFPLPDHRFCDPRHRRHRALPVSGEARQGLQRLENEKKRFKERIKILMEKSRVELEDYKLTEIYELLLQYFEDYINYTERKKDLARIKSSLKEETTWCGSEKAGCPQERRGDDKNEINTSIDTLNIVDDIENETSKIEELIQNIDGKSALLKKKLKPRSGSSSRLTANLSRLGKQRDDERPDRGKERHRPDTEKMEGKPEFAAFHNEEHGQGTGAERGKAAPDAPGRHA